ncbi:DNA gyrase inhibitor YacG [Myxococcaceae bacterium GXIMD 01537]
MTTRAPSCPTCKKPAPSRASGNAYFPFCSRRCRAVDLGRWLGEEYRMPTGSADEQEDEQPSGGHPDRLGDA